MASLESQQETLASQSAAISAQLSTSSDDPMARDDDHDGIAMIGVAYGAQGCGTPHPTCLLAIGDSRTIRNGLQGVPCLLLEIGATEQQRQVELSELSGEIPVELPAGFLEYIGKGFCRRTRQAGITVINPPAEAQPAIDGSQQQPSTGAVVGGCLNVLFHFVGIRRFSGFLSDDSAHPVYPDFSDHRGTFQTLRGFRDFPANPEATEKSALRSNLRARFPIKKT